MNVSIKYESEINNLTKICTENVKTSSICIIIMIFFIFGAIGNFLALLILAQKKNSRNTKYTLMLRCLASNNLIGLMGMLTQLILKLILPCEIQRAYIHWNCIGMVVWRFFGLSSGCIAAVMAMERWMALARPFTYHKHITYNIVKRTIQILVMIATIITFLPFVGFGVYFDKVEKECLRYRDATNFLDIIYAYLFMIFGTLLCTIIVVCNLFVARVLCFIGHRKSSKKSFHYDLVHRERGVTENENITTNIDSGSINKSKEQKRDSHCSSMSNRSGGSQQNNNLPSFHHQSSVSQTSSDEIRFAKLMTFLSISFVICWMPQMISIPLALMHQPLTKSHWFFKIADILMALHFTSDPYIYVISRTKYSFIRDCVKRWRNGFKRTRSDQNRLRTNIDHTMDYGLNI